MSTFLRNLLFYTLLFLWTAALPLFIAPFFVARSLFRGEELCVAFRGANRVYGLGWRWCIAPWVKVRDEGFAPGSMPFPCLAVMNHQSFFDIHCSAALPNHNLVQTPRSWPFRIPFYGRFMRLARYINLESSSYEEVLERVRREAAQGAVIVFFPEGHRSPDRHIRRFHAGAFALALAADLPIVPVCVNGSGAVLPPGTPWIRPGEIRVKALDPVYPEEFRQAGDNAPRLLRRHVQQVMRNAITQL